MNFVEITSVGPVCTPSYMTPSEFETLTGEEITQKPDPNHQPYPSKQATLS